MASPDLTQLLERVRSGEVTVAEAGRALVALSQNAQAVVDLGYAKVDLDRKARLGLPEVVFGEPKTAAEIIGVVRALEQGGQNALVTRIDAARAAEVMATFPAALYHEKAR